MHSHAGAWERDGTGDRMKPLALLLLSLSLLLGTMLTHYILTDRTTPNKALSQLVAVTGLDTPALGSAWYAPRLLSRQSQARNPAYPELAPIVRSEYVYAY